MKRLAWLLILVFGTALAQVSPVDLGRQNTKPCSCCETPGTCGLPDCNLPPPSSPTCTVAEQPASPALIAARTKVTRVHCLAIDFLFSDDAASLALYARLEENVMPAAVPLFKAHCSFLI